MKKKLGRPRTNTKILFRRIPIEYFEQIKNLVDETLKKLKNNE